MKNDESVICCINVGFTGALNRSSKEQPTSLPENLQENMEPKKGEEMSGRQAGVGEMSGRQADINILTTTRNHSPSLQSTFTPCFKSKREQFL